MYHKADVIKQFLGTQLYTCNGTVYPIYLALPSKASEFNQDDPIIVDPLNIQFNLEVTDPFFGYLNLNPFSVWTFSIEQEAVTFRADGSETHFFPWQPIGIENLIYESTYTTPANVLILRYGYNPSGTTQEIPRTPFMIRGNPIKIRLWINSAGNPDTAAVEVTPAMLENFGYLINLKVKRIHEGIKYDDN